MSGILACCGIVAVLLTAVSAPARADEAPARASGPGDIRLSGPYTHENLTIYLVHGRDRIDLSKYITLQEGMEMRKVIVHETGNVGELAIENIGDVAVYVQSGDIVKGGRQDRTIAEDFICPPKSGRVPIASFCVEQGRWQQRGGESAAAFSGSSGNLAGKDLKLAARQAGAQAEVWKQVAENQKKLAGNVGGSVQAAESASSFQLSLENKKLVETTAAYEQKLAAALDKQTDVVGYAFAINGRINSVDLYAASSLFRKMWPKLLKSACVEAVAELQAGKKFEPPAAEAILAFMADAEKGASKSKKISDRVEVQTRETDKAVRFDTVDQAAAPSAAPAEYLHRSYIAK